MIYTTIKENMIRQNIHQSHASENNVLSITKMQNQGVCLEDIITPKIMAERKEEETENTPRVFLTNGISPFSFEKGKKKVDFFQKMQNQKQGLRQLYAKEGTKSKSYFCSQNIIRNNLDQSQQQQEQQIPCEQLRSEEQLSYFKKQIQTEETITKEKLLQEQNDYIIQENLQQQRQNSHQIQFKTLNQETKNQSTTSAYTSFYKSLTTRKSNASQKNNPLDEINFTKCSLKRNGYVYSYAANTNKGLVRNYNEDRVSIILNITRPPSRQTENWPKCSFFGVYDGHGGSECADFLRDQLHQFVIRDPNFPFNPKEAIKNGFEACEQIFLKNAVQNGQIINRSGSCALVLLIVGNICYVANVGDSRAVLSAASGQKFICLTKDHKPNEESEKKRIYEAGGQIYQNQHHLQKSATNPNNQKENPPFRVLPGRLSVSRTFGDAEAKLEQFGGNPNVIISVPDIKSFKIKQDYDFIILASDGVYDKISSKEVSQLVWNSVRSQSSSDIHQQSCLSVETIIRTAILKRSLDNVTVLQVSFENFFNQIEAMNQSKTSQNEQENLKEVSE